MNALQQLRTDAPAEIAQCAEALASELLALAAALRDLEVLAAVWQARRFGGQKTEKVES